MEQTIFTKIVGDSAEMRIIDFLLLEGRLFDYPMTEIAKNSHVSWTTFNEIFPKFIKMGIVKQTRRIGRARLFKLNEDNEITKAWITFWKRISLIATEQCSENVKIPVLIK